MTRLKAFKAVIKGITKYIVAESACLPVV